MKGNESDDTESDIFGSPLQHAENSEIEGDVEAVFQVLQNAKNSAIKGDVDTTVSVLEDAENSVVEGDVEARRNVLEGAEDSRVEGDVKRASKVLPSAENSVVKGSVEAGSVLTNAQDSVVEDNVEARVGVLNGAESSVVEGEVNAETALLNSVESVIKGDVDVDRLLYNSENSYVMAKQVSAQRAGIDSLGGLIAAEELDADQTGENLSVLTGEGSQGMTFGGNWDDLHQYLSEEQRKEGFGELRGLEIFTTPPATSSSDQADIEDLDDFKSSLTRVNQMHDLVEDNLEFYRSLKQETEVPMYDLSQMSQSDRFLYLWSFRERAALGVSEYLGADRDATEVLLESDSPAALINETKRFSHNNTDLQHFIHTHDGGARPDYERQYTVDVGQATNPDTDEIDTGLGLEMTRWNEDIRDVPTCDETGNHRFLGSGEGRILEYMDSDSVDILEFEADDRYGVAVAVHGQNELGEDTMLIDTVESDSDILEREDVVETLSEAVEDYARDQGCAEVIYALERDHPFGGPCQFYKNLGLREVDEKTIDIENKSDIYVASYLEDLDGMTCKVARV